MAVAVAVLLMLAGPFRRSDPWARWAVPAVGVTFTTLTAYAAYTIDTTTPADTPWRPTLVLAAEYLLGGALSYRRRG